MGNSSVKQLQLSNNTTDTSFIFYHLSCQKPFHPLTKKWLPELLATLTNSRVPPRKLSATSPALSNTRPKERHNTPLAPLKTRPPSLKTVLKPPARVSPAGQNRPGEL